MSDKEILEKAIQKAIDGGWKQPEVPVVFIVGDSDGNNDITREAYWLIYSHDFAKALWGEERDLQMADDYFCQEAHTVHTDLPSYKWHLQNMVVSDDPIKYLGENI